MLVEEHKSEDDLILRSLIFKSNLIQIQSQVKLKYFSSDDKKKSQIIDVDSQKLTLLQAKKGKLVGIDESFLAFESHRFIKNYS